MKIKSTCRHFGNRGYSLLELLVYMAVFVIVVGFAVETCFSCWDSTKALRRNADEVARAVDVGERWRADIRRSTGAVQVTVENGVEQCRIPVSSGQVTYTYGDGEIRRQADLAAPTLWLGNVKASHIQTDSRGQGAWRWELELKTKRREARMRPLFTFETVAGTTPIQ